MNRGFEITGDEMHAAGAPSDSHNLGVGGTPSGVDGAVRSTVNKEPNNNPSPSDLQENAGENAGVTGDRPAPADSDDG